MTAPGPRTTLYRGGNVYSPADPFATAMLVVDGQVAWVGSDGAADAGAADAVVELDGALVTPAFVDSHVHTTETGLALEGVDCTGARSLAELLELVERAARRCGGRAVLGHGWDERHWPEPRPPRRQELDRASWGGVVYLGRIDVHSAVVSTALAVSAGLRDLDGWSEDGRVERDAHHGARDATRSALTREHREHLQRRALRRAASAGVAAVHEMSAPHVAPQDDLPELVALAAAADLPDVVPYHGELVADTEGARQVVEGLAARGVRLAGLGGDLCVDGSVGSRTAAFRGPYADAPAQCGHLYLDADAVAAHLLGCIGAGIGAGFHVIGDAAVDAVAEGLRRAAAEVGRPAVCGLRTRLEHLEAVDATTAADLAAYAVVASVQPAFDAAWGGPASMYAERLGPTRGPLLNPLALLASAGIPLAFGSDTPVTPFDPWGAVRAAAFHRTPGHRISARAAFLAHTRGGHRAAGSDDPLAGVLAPGAPATFAVWEPSDLVVQTPDARVQGWSTDPRSGTPGLPDLSEGVPAPACRATVLRGRTIYAADPGAVGAGSADGGSSA